MKRYLARLKDNLYHYRVGDGVRSELLRPANTNCLQAPVRPPARFRRNPSITIRIPGNQITAWNAVPVLTDDQLDLDVGYVTEAGKADEG